MKDKDIPSGEITSLTFSDSRFEENGISSPEEGYRIREQIRQLGDWESMEIEYNPVIEYRRLGRKKKGK